MNLYIVFRVGWTFFCRKTYLWQFFVKLKLGKSKKMEYAAISLILKTLQLGSAHIYIYIIYYIMNLAYVKVIKHKIFLPFDRCELLVWHWRVKYAKE